MKHFVLFIAMWIPVTVLGLTPAQREILRAAVAAQRAAGVSDTSLILAKLTSQPVVGSSNLVQVITRDPVQVQTERLAKSIASKYGLTGADSPQQMDAKFDAALAAAATVAAKTDIIRDEGKFWAAYIAARNVNAVGDATVTNIIAVSVYGAPLIQFGITGQDVEAAQQ